jgi:predicted CopG family antitoxin
MNRIIEEEKGQSMEIEDEIYERLNNIKKGEVSVVEVASNLNFGQIQGLGIQGLGKVEVKN